MDYTNDPDGGPGGASNNDPDNEHPNNHDYTQLMSIYNPHRLHQHGDSGAAGVATGRRR
jgi:hypothetical protein